MSIGNMRVPPPVKWAIRLGLWALVFIVVFHFGTNLFLLKFALRQDAQNREQQLGTDFQQRMSETHIMDVRQVGPFLGANSTGGGIALVQTSEEGAALMIGATYPLVSWLGITNASINRH